MMIDAESLAQFSLDSHWPRSGNVPCATTAAVVAIKHCIVQKKHHAESQQAQQAQQAAEQRVSEARIVVIRSSGEYSSAK